MLSYLNHHSSTIAVIEFDHSLNIVQCSCLFCEAFIALVKFIDSGEFSFILLSFSAKCNIRPEVHNDEKQT